MASVEQADGSEDVTDFLRRIKELGDKRDREDEERAKQLEHDIIEGRKQREARRADRARSLSPEKSSPSTTPRSMRSPRTLPRSDFASSPLNASSTPSFPATIGSVMEEPSSSSTEPYTSRPELPPRSVSPARVATQTPESSSEIPETPTKSFQNAPTPTRSSTLSWQQRPASLRGSRTVELKEPSLGTTSASSPLAQASASQTVESPALSRDQIAQSLSSKDPTWFRQTEDRGVGSAALRRNMQDTEYQHVTTQRRALHGMSGDSFQNSNAAANEAKPFHGTSALASSNDVGIEPSAVEVSDRMLERPASPTKGLGGFVQSAMLKRSESVNKRWSAQTPLDPTKQESVVSSRTDALVGGSGSSAAITRSIETSRESTAEPSSRPSSSHSNTTSQLGQDTLIKPSMPQHIRSQSSLNLRSGIQSRSTDEPTPPSPSKRWSPQKSSWLESALNRPESPTPKSPTSKYSLPQQPAWMVELNRAKQQRASRDILDPAMSKSGDSAAPKTDSETPAEAMTALKLSPSPPATKPKPSSLMQSPPLASTEHEPTTPATQDSKGKTKPETPPKKDFRSQLRSSKPTQEKSGQQEPEFLNAFGKLKRTQTEKYVAPDELKNNILRGKSALAVTDGPQKTQRRDELKESLVQQREAMKAKAADPNVASVQQRPANEQAIPEAIAKKQALGRNDSSGNIMGSPKPEIKNEQTYIEPGGTTMPIASKSPPMLQTSVSNSNLANKFNSGLASIIARGPPSSTGSNASPTTSRGNPRTITSSARTDTPGVETAAGQLQHMTKGRARGPKRRLPNVGSAAPQTQPTAATIETLASSISTPSSTRPLPPVKPRNITSDTPTIGNSAAAKAAPEILVDTSSKPQPPVKSPQLNTFRGSPKAGVDISASNEKSTSGKSSANDASALWGRPLKPAQSPQPASVKSKEIAGNEDAGLNRLKDISTGLIGPNSNFSVSKASPVAPKKPLETKMHSPMSNKPSATATSRNVTSQQFGFPKSPEVAPKPQLSTLTASEKLLADSFGDIVLAPTKLDIDSNAVLLSNPQAGGSRNKTIRKEIYELKSDGKTAAAPSHQEHVLYSDRMYLCSHIFEDSLAARIAEVYLWAGSVVGDAAVEDAQLFARKAAKDAGGLLLIIRQGKEPASFFQALGGILITRNAKTRESSSPYMLCGRQHLGHLAFDEVQFSASSLCSGFTYIIAAGLNNTFLWKGSGCNTEELAGARLLSMDMDPQGKVTEVDEGKEPRGLMTILSSASDGLSVPRSADHWKLKAKYDNYRSRLFHVEYCERPISRQDSGPAALWKLVRRGSQANLSSSSSTRTQINEIVPFAQSDLQSESIYVLDAFFEMYIIVGSGARSKPEAFSSALLFAQEYAVLSASTENRPYVPVTTVVLEGVPRDLKRVFRTWDDSLIPTGTGVDGGGVKRGKSLKVMPLSQALGALRSATEPKP